MEAEVYIKARKIFVDDIIENTEKCPYCERKNESFYLRFFYISLEEAIYKCANPQCLFPFDHFKFRNLKDKTTYYYEEIEDEPNNIMFKPLLDGSRSSNPLSTKLFTDSQRNNDIESYDFDLDEFLDNLNTDTSDEHEDVLSFFNDLPKKDKNENENKTGQLTENDVDRILHEVLNEPTAIPSTSTGITANSQSDVKLTKCMEHIKKNKEKLKAKVTAPKKTFLQQIDKTKAGPSKSNTPNNTIKEKVEKIISSSQNLRPTALLNQLKSLDLKNSNSCFIRQLVKIKGETTESGPRIWPNQCKVQLQPKAEIVTTVASKPNEVKPNGKKRAAKNDTGQSSTQQKENKERKTKEKQNKKSTNKVLMTEPAKLNTSYNDLNVTNHSLPILIDLPQTSEEYQALLDENDSRHTVVSSIELNLFNDTNKIDHDRIDFTNKTEEEIEEEEEGEEEGNKYGDQIAHNGSDIVDNATVINNESNSHLMYSESETTSSSDYENLSSENEEEENFNSSKEEFDLLGFHRLTYNDARESLNNLKNAIKPPEQHVEKKSTKKRQYNRKKNLSFSPIPPKRRYVRKKNVTALTSLDSSPHHVNITSRKKQNQTNDDFVEPIKIKSTDERSSSSASVDIKQPFIPNNGMVVNREKQKIDTSAYYIIKYQKKPKKDFVAIEQLISEWDDADNNEQGEQSDNYRISVGSSNSGQLSSEILAESDRESIISLTSSNTCVELNTDATNE